MLSFHALVNYLNSELIEVNTKLRKKTNPSKWLFSSLTFLTINLNWNGCLTFFFDNLEDTQSETVEDNHCNWESCHCAHFSALHVSVHSHSVRDMILHYEKDENLCAIYIARKTDTVAYMSPGCPYLPGCDACCCYTVIILSVLVFSLVWLD